MATVGIVVTFSPVIDKRLADDVAEQVRRSIAQAIRELQGYATDLGDAPGRFVGPPRKLTGTTTYVPTPGTTLVLVEQVGGGGGGGGGQGGVGTAAAGGGGASGVYLYYVVGALGGRPLRGGLAVGGALGAGGVNTGGNGVAGGDSTIVLNDVTYTAKGGAGAFGMLASVGNAFAGEGAPSLTGSSALLVLEALQGAGAPGICVAGPFAWSGFGGSTPMGSGGHVATTFGAGNPGLGLGSGGSGASVAAAGAAGGDGAPGGFLIWECR